jgi:hypothetical protein
MMRWLRVSSVSATFGACAFLGCNTILENEKGVLLPSDEAGVSADPARGARPPSEPSAEAAAPDAGGTTPPSECPTGETMCVGACVSMLDPRFGCGDPSCTACPSAHGTATCQGKKCVVAACDRGYADCNALAADGCEVDLSKPKTCGGCNSVCTGATPLCTPAGPSFHCTNGCTLAAPLDCGGRCVDPMTSVNDCGACDVKCPVVANAISACTATVCSFACNPLFHKCAGACVAVAAPTACGPACTVCPAPVGGTATCVADACGMTCAAPSHLCGSKCVGVGPVDNDPLACGAACTVCPVPANGTATCVAGACGIACTPGHGNCDALAANGCEAVFASDPLNCGMCAKSCGAQACVAGVCLPLPPPP